MYTIKGYRLDPFPEKISLNQRKFYSMLSVVTLTFYKGVGVTEFEKIVTKLNSQFYGQRD